MKGYEMYIVSRCLLGCNCKYNGGNNKNDEVIEFCKTRDYVTICPETDAGLSSPREPAEIQLSEDGTIRVADRAGRDLTEQFKEGAEISLQTAMDGLRDIGESAVIKGAILKANSPSCGSGVIYDGSFTGTKTSGNGIFTSILSEAFEREEALGSSRQGRRLFSESFKLVDENNIAELIK